MKKPTLNRVCVLVEVYDSMKESSLAHIGWALKRMSVGDLRVTNMSGVSAGFQESLQTVVVEMAAGCGLQRTHVRAGGRHAPAVQLPSAYGNIQHQRGGGMRRRDPILVLN